MLQVIDTDTGRPLGKLETSPEQWRQLIESRLVKLREAVAEGDFNGTQVEIGHLEDLLGWVTTFRKGDLTPEVFSDHPELVNGWRSELARCSAERDRLIALVSDFERRCENIRRLVDRVEPATPQHLFRLLIGDAQLDTGEHLLDGLPALVDEACKILGEAGVLRTPTTEASCMSLREQLDEARRYVAWLKATAKKLHGRR